jgi:hypothetical protein
MLKAIESTQTGLAQWTAKFKPDKRSRWYSLDLMESAHDMEI